MQGGSHVKGYTGSEEEVLEKIRKLNECIPLYAEKRWGDSYHRGGPKGSRAHLDLYWRTSRTNARRKFQSKRVVLLQGQ